MRRYTGTLLAILVVGQVDYATAALFQGRFEGIISDSAIDGIQNGQTISGNFAIKPWSPGVGLEYLDVTAQQLFLDNQPLASPWDNSGWGLELNDTVPFGGSGPANAIHIYLGWAAPTSYRGSHGGGWSDPVTMPPEFVGFGVGLEFTGATWFDRGNVLEALLADPNSFDVYTWVESRYTENGFLEVGRPGRWADFVLTQFVLVPEPAGVAMIVAMIGIAGFRPRQN